MRATAKWPCRASCLAALAVLLASGSAAAERGEGREVVVDRIVAVVEGDVGRSEEARIVTRFELVVEARLALAERARSVEAASVEPPQSLLDAVLRTILDEMLVQREAEILGAGTVPAAVIAAERRALEGRLGGPGSLERFRQVAGASQDLIDAIVARRAAVREELARQVALSGSITEAELRQALDSPGHPFEGRQLEEVRDELEAYLVGRREQERLSSWLEELRARTRVRLIDE